LGERERFLPHLDLDAAGELDDDIIDRGHDDTGDNRVDAKEESGKVAP
jgi:hypothetical protein